MKNTKNKVKKMKKNIKVLDKDKFTLIISRQAGKQASRQAGKQASRQAGRQAGFFTP